MARFNRKHITANTPAGRKEIVEYLRSNGFEMKTNFESLVVMQKTFAQGFVTKVCLSRSALEARTTIVIGDSIHGATASLPWQEAGSLPPARAVVRVLDASRSEFFAKLKEKNKIKQ